MSNSSVKAQLKRTATARMQSVSAIDETIRWPIVERVRQTVCPASVERYVRKALSCNSPGQAKVQCSMKGLQISSRGRVFEDICAFTKEPGAKEQLVNK